MTATGIETMFETVGYILSKIDPAGVMEAKIPQASDFFCEDAKELHYAYLRFLDSKKDSYAQDGEESNAKPDGDSDGDENLGNSDGGHTSIGQKLESKQYSSVYALFHDIKIASISKTLEAEENPELYKKVDTFYKVSVEILLREALNLGFILKNDLNGASNGSADLQNDSTSNEIESPDNIMRRSKRSAQKTESEEETKINGESQIEKVQDYQNKKIYSAEQLITSLEKEFNIITSTFYNSTGKVLSIFARERVPFFSSLNKGQSELDDREPVIDPSLNTTVVNVIPNVSLKETETLSKFSVDTKVPNIKQILENYMHPNWLRLISSQWLKHGDGVTSLNFTFAPTYDETQSIISNDWKGLTWVQQIGFKNLLEFKQKLQDNTEPMDIDEQESGKSDENKSEQGPSDISEKKADVDEKKKAIDKINNAIDSPLDDSEIFDENKRLIEKIDLQQILKWDASKTIDEEEIEIIKGNKVQSTISELISELSKLRQDRIQLHKKLIRYNKSIMTANSKIVKPSIQELKVYHKVKRLLTGLIDSKSIKPEDISLEYEPRLPVLQHTYQGTLPAAFATPASKTRTKRRR